MKKSALNKKNSPDNHLKYVINRIALLKNNGNIWVTRYISYFQIAFKSSLLKILATSDCILACAIKESKYFKAFSNNFV